MDTYHIDDLGLLPSMKKIYCHILAVIDGFSKFVWLYPTRKTKTSDVVYKLLRQSAVFGNPRRIILDRGTAFLPTEFKDYCSDEGIQHSIIATGVPRGNRAEEAIAEIQKENKKMYDKKRKIPTIYEGDLVAIKRTQRGPEIKLCVKFLGLYKITHVLRGDRYLIQKIGQGEGLII